MPSLTSKQHRAMEAAKSGNSTIGIPQSVGAEFSAADEAMPKGTFKGAMQHHGFSKGDGKHKRHPATGSHSAFGSKGNRYEKRR
jgi:hypothetical protein